jgi:hypothetical protein
MDHKGLNSRLTSARVLLVDDEYYMRKIVRTMLLGPRRSRLGAHSRARSGQ